MGIATAWTHVVCRNRPIEIGPVLGALAPAGVRCFKAPIDALSGTGIVFFDEPGPQLIDFVRTASRGGVERVLAVAVGEDALPARATWTLLSAGASDVIPWARHAAPATEIAARLERWQAVDAIVDAPVVRDNLIGRSPAWLAVLRHVVEVARFTNASVLVLGETGTGKELIARLVHTLDQRQRKGDLVVMDCATVVPQLAGSEFFGHERGAFTDAVAAREGCFSLAHGGTLFLDEIGELPLGLQPELLRAVQERTYKRVGGNAWRKSEFRLVCASNRDLLHEVELSAFRSDLYYRVASVVVRLPPLRERTEDIIPLAQTFLSQLHPERDAPELDEPVREHLLSREYPGNVRDLRQLMHRIAARHAGTGPITVGDVPPEERPLPDAEPIDWRDAAFENAIRRAVVRGVGLKDIGQAATDVAVEIAVHAEGSLARAAQQLGVTDRALQLRRAAKRRMSPGTAGE
jgi:transcriptional regulator with GAF, ATPase, and Fis domain